MSVILIILLIATAVKCQYPSNFQHNQRYYQPYYEQPPYPYNYHGFPVSSASYYNPCAPICDIARDFSGLSYPYPYFYPSFYQNYHHMNPGSNYRKTYNEYPHIPTEIIEETSAEVRKEKNGVPVIKINNSTQSSYTVSGNKLMSSSVVTSKPSHTTITRIFDSSNDTPEINIDVLNGEYVKEEGIAKEVTTASPSTTEENNEEDEELVEAEVQEDDEKPVPVNGWHF